MACSPLILQLLVTLRVQQVLPSLLSFKDELCLLEHFPSSPWGRQQPHCSVFLPGQVYSGHQYHNLWAPLQINGFNSKDNKKTKREKWLTPVPRGIKEEEEGDRKEKWIPQPHLPEGTEVMLVREWNKMDFSEGGWAGVVSVWLF